MLTVPGSTIVSGSSTSGSRVTFSISSTAGSSSSRVVTTSSTSATGANSAAEAASTTDSLTVEVMSPSSSVSFSPLTVTSCASLQVSGVNVRTAGETVVSDGSDEVTLITTVPVGLVESTTAMVSLVSVSDTIVVPSVAVAVKPAASLSVVVTLTTAVRAAYMLSALEVTRDTVDAWFSSMIRSLEPVIVKSWATLQSPGVNVMVDGATRASPSSEPVTETVTTAVGFESSTIWRVAVEPDSDTVTAKVETVKPKVSSSTVVIVTDWSSRAA